jgi:hypothetical protein
VRRPGGPATTCCACGAASTGSLLCSQLGLPGVTLPKTSLQICLAELLWRSITSYV